MYAFLRGVMRFITRTYLIGGLFTVEGTENVPMSGALIVCPNHFGTIDPPMVPAFLPRSDSWSMAKSEFFLKGWMRWIFTAYQSFPVVRHTADRQALRRSFDLLKAGQVLVIYPEGHRQEKEVLGEPEPGAGFIAQKSGAQVLPVALTGTAECLPRGAHWPRRVRVSLKYGKPIQVETRRPDGTRVSHEEASDQIMAAIAELLPAEMRGRFGKVPA